MKPGAKVKDVPHLRNAIAALKPGSQATLNIIRDGHAQKVDVVLGELEGGKKIRPDNEDLSKLLHFSVSPLTKDLAKAHDLDANSEGVIVTKIESIATAYRAGLREGDLIFAINRQAVIDLKSFTASIKSLKKGDTALFQIQRGDGNLFIAFTL